MNEFARIEGFLFLAGKEGIQLKELARICDYDIDTLKTLLEEFQCHLRSDDHRAVVLEYQNEAVYLSIKPEYTDYFLEYIDHPADISLSKAAYEVLAMVAYQQPISRTEIEVIRGVRSEKVLQTLLDVQLIQEVGRADSPGRAILYGTTPLFLTFMGIDHLSELPEIEQALVDQLTIHEAIDLEKMIEEEG